MEVKVGDVVHVRGTVLSTGHGDTRTIIEVEVRRCANGFSNHVYVSNEDIVHVEPRPLAVGDKVTWGNGILSFVILAISSGWALLRVLDEKSCVAKPMEELRLSTEGP